MFRMMLSVFLSLAVSGTASLCAQSTSLRSDLVQISASLSAVVRSGAITRDDVQAIKQMVRDARADGVVSEEEREAIRGAIEALKSKIPAELADPLKASVETFKNDFNSLVSSKVSPEVKAAAAAVVSDLKEIMQGGYISRSDLQALRKQMTQALSHGALSEEDQQALAASAQTLAAGVPADLLAKLLADVQALSGLIGSKSR